MDLQMLKHEIKARIARDGDKDTCVHCFIQKCYRVPGDYGAQVALDFLDILRHYFSYEKARALLSEQVILPKTSKIGETITFGKCMSVEDFVQFIGRTA